MGIFDRFGRQQSTGRSDASQAALSENEQALARYRYMLKTAPPETIEQAHAEAFARLTPEQRRMLLAQLAADLPAAEQLAVARAGDDPSSLARTATRAEVRQPGTLERTFGRMGGAPGFGSMLAGGFLASMAGTVLGTMIAQHFLAQHPLDALHGASDIDAADADIEPDVTDAANVDDGIFGGGDLDVGGGDIIDV